MRAKAGQCYLLQNWVGPTEVAQRVIYVWRRARNAKQSLARSELHKAWVTVTTPLYPERGLARLTADKESLFYSSGERTDDEAGWTHKLQSVKASCKQVTIHCNKCDRKRYILGKSQSQIDFQQEDWNLYSVC